jgi:hypothetical protein
MYRWYDLNEYAMLDYCPQRMFALKLCVIFIDELNYQAIWMPVQLRLTCDDNSSSCLLIAQLFQFWAFSMAVQK